MTRALTSLPRADHFSALAAKCTLLDLQLGQRFNGRIVATHASTGSLLDIVYFKHTQNSFEPVRVEDLEMDPVGESIVNLLLNAHQLRHLIMRDITELDWILLIAELWPLFAQLYTLELGCLAGVLGTQLTVGRGSVTEKVPLYRAASRLRETIRLRWISVGRRDLLPDDIKGLVELPELTAAKAILEDDYVSSIVCAAWNRSDDKGPPAPVLHPMGQRYRDYLQDSEDTGGSRWVDGFFGKVNDEWEALAASAIRENN